MSADEKERMDEVEFERFNDLFKGLFTKREFRLIRNSIIYAEDDPAGLPGHNLMVIIYKMAELMLIIEPRGRE